MYNLYVLFALDAFDIFLSFVCRDGDRPSLTFFLDKKSNKKIKAKPNASGRFCQTHAHKLVEN